MLKPEAQSRFALLPSVDHARGIIPHENDGELRRASALLEHCACAVLDVGFDLLEDGLGGESDHARYQ